ncbi:glycosyltransferase [Actinoplanes sp. KI2]|uniref:glycosyltransferase family 2 protein n=1 Tax=Actinoplanes sp. KI2 TaxID=2983315 RepID=UPI0021D58F25|nr:glycosyltransferase [Actinoplanes sp. KI2]MCU7727527.1 glycosyltransferase [Actinoplanes sp. KI2]
MSCTVVVPTLGRPSLGRLLAALAGPAEVLVVDDRRDRSQPLPVPAGVTVVPGPARGPAAARNVGWRAAATEWVAFLDDDVLPDPGWLDRLAEDLAAAPAQVGGVQGELRVPLPAGRRPTDWERVTAGLATGKWITADMAYRRGALARAGGFDERLPRAFREDAELAFRVRRAGWALTRGARRVTHPVRPEGPWVSLRTQRGNADDALLRRLYGPQWRSELGVPPGRRRRHAAIVAAGSSALACGLAAVVSGRRDRRRRSWGRRDRGRRDWAGAAVLAAAAWAAGTAEFAAARIRPGPRDPREVAAMLATSVAIPPVAVAHWLRGWWRWRGARPLPIEGPAREPVESRR